LSEPVIYKDPSGDKHFLKVSQRKEEDQDVIYRLIRRDCDRPYADNDDRNFLNGRWFGGDELKDDDGNGDGSNA
jgi:hypothetical protein